MLGLILPTVWMHLVKKRVEQSRDELIIGLAVLTHDMGKPNCTTVGEDGRIRSIGHERLGVPKSQRVFREID